MTALQAGQVISRYRVIEKIGSGGMGEIWAAEDQRLKRKVALKFLPTWTAEDARVRARFEREAQAVAALNHPNIVTIHSVEEEAGRLFLSMELVEGHALTQHMHGALPLNELFALAVPLAGAVAAAHDRGILHRDLKPANVMVTPEGNVKVLDFGLAKLHEHLAAQVADAETDDQLTQDGRVVGTAAYMSPEQAEGKAVGPESDVFALGIILYQLATGDRPFRGDTAISLMSSILKDDPAPVTQVNRELPRHLGRIVRRCLEKDPTRRYASARELRNELQNLQAELAAADSDPEQVLVRRSSRRALWGAVGALALMTAIAAAGWIRPGGRAPAASAFEAAFSQQTFGSGVETDPTLSPDGAFLAYAALAGPGNSDIFLLRVDGRNPINLTRDHPGYDGTPVFSPDGDHIVFRSGREGGGLFMMGATGESVRRLTDFGFDPAWSPDGTEIVFATEGVTTPFTRVQTSELHVVDVESGKTRRIYGGDAVQPNWSPGGERIVFWTSHVGGGRSGQRDVGTVDPGGADPVPLFHDLAVDWCPRWSSDGSHVYFASDRGGSMNLWRLRVDAGSGRPRGEPEPVVTPALWAGPFSLGAAGTMIAYVARDDRSALMAVAIDPASGRVSETPEPIIDGTLLVQNWDLSPDGEWITFSDFGRQEDVYLIKPDGTGLRKLTDDLHKDRGVSWLDPDHVVFYSNRGGGYEMWSVRKDGSELRCLSETSGRALWMPAVSPDGARLMAINSEGTYLFDLGAPGPLRKESAEHIGAPDSTGAVFRGYDWSRDGSRILGRLVGAQRTLTAVWDLATGDLRVFEPPVEGNATEAGWFPDGRRFAAVAGGFVWMVDEAGTWRKILPMGGTGTAKLTDDGKTLHFVETSTEADIWIARQGRPAPQPGVEED